MVSAVLNAVGKRFLVEHGESSDENGSYWYDRYSDGWVEQGGRVFSARPPTTMVTFFIEFKEVPTILLGGYGFKDIASYEGGVDMGSVSMTGFTYVGLSKDQSIRNSFYWEAKGYAA